MTGRINVIWDRTGTGLGEDVAINTFHWSGVLSGPFVDAFAARWTTNWPTIAGAFANEYKVDRFVGYNEGPPPNTPIGTAEVNLVGTSTSAPLPPQCALTVTERTLERRYWGRIYLPGLSTATVNALGRFDSSWCTTFANWAALIYADLVSGTTKQAVVYSRLGAVERDILKIQVDDLFDVQRRRRYRAPTIREERTL